MIKKILLTFTLLTATLLAEDDLVINLKDPTYSGGILRTEEGGVITAPNLRIQAQNIEYINRTEEGEKVQRVTAEGDLMLEFGERVFVGKKLDYDLIKRRGTLYEGKTYVDFWFIGGEEIKLAEDGSFTVIGGFVTTSESQSNFWEIKTGLVNISPEGLFSARDIRLRLGNIPIFWLPAFKGSLKLLHDSPFRFRLLWDKGIGPRLSARYRFYSRENFNAFLRLDYRLKLGPGAALETEYLSPDEHTQFITRSYGAYDKSFPNEKGDKRYRLQGLLHSTSLDQRTQLHLQWDKLSDDRMVSDFKDSDFEVNTQKSTYLHFSHYAENGFTQFNVRPRINSFQTLNQELPYLAIGLRPLEIWNTGIIAENYANVAYLDYIFPEHIDDFLPARRSGRIETENTLYRPIHIGPITATPKAGIVGIFYSQSPEHEAAGQFVFTYGGELSTRLYRTFSCYKHLAEPYLSYQGYSHPRAGLDRTYIFDINDGYFKINQLRLGLKNTLYNCAQERFLPRFDWDLYTYAFFKARSFKETFPKLYGDFEINMPKYSITSQLCWNFQEQLLDRGNVHLLYTLNDAFAFGIEYRYRSAFDWRKADHQNYVVDFARPLDELLASPLSDRRDTLLARAFIHLTPRWSLNLETFHGWNRKHEPNYHGAKVEFYTTLTSNWQFRISYEYTPNDPYRFSYSFRLLK